MTANQPSDGSLLYAVMVPSPDRTGGLVTEMVVRGRTPEDWQFTNTRTGETWQFTGLRFHRVGVPDADAALVITAERTEVVRGMLDKHEQAMLAEQAFQERV